MHIRIIINSVKYVIAADSIFYVRKDNVYTNNEYISAPFSISRIEC